MGINTNTAASGETEKLLWAARNRNPLIFRDFQGLRYADSLPVFIPLPFSVPTPIGAQCKCHRSKKKPSKVTKIRRNRRFNIIIFFLDILFDVSKYGEIKKLLLLLWLL